MNHNRELGDCNIDLELQQWKHSCFNVIEQRCMQMESILQPCQEIAVVAGIHSLHDHEFLITTFAQAVRKMSKRDTHSGGRFHPENLTS